jgi:ferric-dicitrate binding protein FerR (iron transport regulator)
VHPPERAAPGRLRRSMAELEHAFSREISLERHRRDSLKRTAEQRTLKREVQRRHKRGSMRFALLVLTLVMTAVIVTVVMFRVLYLLLS